MARAYGVLSRDNWTDASLTELLQLELEGFGEGRAILSGADLRVKPRQGLSLSMVLHELATNAGRYGALSEAGGTVRIGWAVEEGHLRLHWQEVGGPEVRDPETNGFGLMLIKGEITYRLAGKVDMAFKREGLEVMLSMPLDG